MLLLTEHRAKATVQKKNYALHKQKIYLIIKHEKHEHCSCSI